MIRDICKDELFLSQKSEPATADDPSVAQDLLDTLAAHKDGYVGMRAHFSDTNLKRIRTTYGCTQAELAKRSGVSPGRSRCTSSTTRISIKPARRRFSALPKSLAAQWRIFGKNDLRDGAILCLLQRNL